MPERNPLRQGPWHTTAMLAHANTKAQRMALCLRKTPRAERKELAQSASGWDITPSFRLQARLLWTCCLATNAPREGARPKARRATLPPDLAN